MLCKRRTALWVIVRHHHITSEGTNNGERFPLQPFVFTRDYAFPYDPCPKVSHWRYGASSSNNNSNINKSAVNLLCGMRYSASILSLFFSFLAWDEIQKYLCGSRSTCPPFWISDGGMSYRKRWGPPSVRVNTDRSEHKGQSQMDGEQTGSAQSNHHRKPNQENGSVTAFSYPCYSKMPQLISIGLIAYAER